MYIVHSGHHVRDSSLPMDHVCSLRWVYIHNADPDTEWSILLIHLHLEKKMCLCDCLAVEFMIVSILTILT